MRIKTIGEINNEILEENPFISKRLLREERTKRLSKLSPKIKLPKATGGCARLKKPLVKAWFIKARKELLKPLTPKPDKDYWLKKTFPNCTFTTLSYTDNAIKHWVSKGRGI